MLTLFVISWLPLANVWEDHVFPAVDALEKVLTPMVSSRRVGNIIVIGNDITPDSTILEQLSLYPGCRLFFWRMGLAQLRLIGSGLFKVDIQNGVWPRVSTPDREGDRKFVDIKVEVEERIKKS